jgi:putative transposase
VRARTTRPGRAARAERGAPNGRDFFPWYNTEYHHIGLGLFTPHDVDYGLAAAKREQRARVLAEAFALHRD